MTALSVNPWTDGVRSNTLGWLLRVSLFAMIATSSVVMIEPAPCDALFLPTAVLIVLSGYPLIAGPLRPALHGGLLLFVAANLWTLPGSDGLGDAVKFAAITIYLLVLWMMLASVIAVHGMRAIRLLVAAFWVAAGIATAVALLARYHLIPGSERFYLDEFGYRIKSTFKDPNVFGPFLVTAIIFVIAHLLHGAKRWLYYSMVLLAFACGLLLAFSRGAYVNLAVCLAALLFIEIAIVRDARVLRRLVSLTIPVLVFGALVVPVLLASTGMDEFFAHRLSFQSYDNDRFANQANALSVAAAEPFGIGPGQWEFPRYAFATHNLYIRVLVETGWPGLVGFLAFAGSCAWVAWSAILRGSRFVGVHVASLSVMAGTLLESIVIDTLHWRHLFFAMALPIGLDAYERARR